MTARQIALVIFSAAVCAALVVVILSFWGLQNPVPVAGGVAGGITGAVVAGRAGRTTKK